VTVVIGGSRDARPHKARKPKKGSVEVRWEVRWEEEWARRPISVCIYLFAYDGPGSGQGRRGCCTEPVIGRFTRRTGTVDRIRIKSTPAIV